MVLKTLLLTILLNSFLSINNLSQELGYSDNRKQNNLYTYSDEIISKKHTRYNKVLKEYINHYNQLGKEEGLSYDSIKFRDVTQKELKQLDFEYQAGMELIYWLTDLKKTSITNKDLFNGIIQSLDSINTGLKFPIAEYNNYRDLTHVLGFTLGEILHKDYGWKWKFKDVYNNDYLGFVIVSPDKLTGLKVEHYFYDNVMYKRDIKLIDFIEKLTNNKIEKTKFSFYEPWLNK